MTLRLKMRSSFPLFAIVAAAFTSAITIPSPFDEGLPEIETDKVITNDRHTSVSRSRGTGGIFEHKDTQTRLNYVADSGICETTPGVKQKSGYMTVGSNMNMWFWQFEARKDAANAPLVAWFNGGPGCSSMIGLFQEHGPCQFYGGATKPTLNKYSWNEYANMIYIDQPIGTGFSYGTSNTSTSLTASPYVWKLIQNFYAAFPDYKSRDFGIFTESYGGHYGPEFVRYILEQNRKIEASTLKGEKINIVALGINNGWINPADAYKGMINFAADNKYKPMLTASQKTTYLNTFKTRCLPLLEKCWKSDSNSDCSRSNTMCKITIESPLQRVKNFNVYDVRESSAMKDINPPGAYIKWLQSSTLQSTIGAKKKYEECPNGPLLKFSNSGDGTNCSIPSNMFTALINAL